MTQKSISIADRVFEALENDILSGQYPAGTVLTELQLSEKLSVSRTPIREAIRRLEQEKLVGESGKGIVVLGISPQDLADIYEVRSRIEGLCAAKAARRITPRELAELREILELQEFYIQRQDAEKIKLTDTDFHGLLYDFCGSETLRDILELLHRRIQLYRRASLSDSARARQAAGEHRKIYDAIAAGDAAAAESSTVTHIQNAYARISAAEAQKGTK